MGKFINPFTDYGFKKIFGQEVSKELLIEFLNDLLEGERVITDLTFLNNEQLPIYPGERIAIYDIFCTTDTGEKIIVEMQNRSQVYFKERALYYLSHAIVRQELNKKGGKCFFMGSSEKVLSLIKEKAAVVYPNITVETYSPPYKPEFTAEENKHIIEAINRTNPDLLWIGMTAPKQEKWTYIHWNELNIHCHVGTIGAVFDFFAGTVKRAPLWWQEHSLEWLYRLIKEPGRMWRRYIIGNILFLWNIVKEKYSID